MIPILLLKLPIFTLPMYIVSLGFVSSYGLIVMILGFCVSGSTAAVHTGDAGSSPTKQFFSFNNFFNVHNIVKVTNTELQDIN